MNTIIELIIKEANRQAHIDIEQVMQEYKGKWYHFEVRYSGGNIVDFVTREYITYEEFKQE